MNQMSEEKPQEKSIKMENQFFGEVPDMQKDKECAIIGLIKNQIIVLEEDLNHSKVLFANAARDQNLHWTIKYERDCECKVIEGKIAILNKMQRDFENMMTPMSNPMVNSMPIAS